ncbi:MAG TPA: hypothetical protein H9837_02825 [Candidatus Brachybacterium merdigallinarum]|nr:hypothetical protein [Candidatus Brachybacterium merdigallinarum]
MVTHATSATRPALRPLLLNNLIAALIGSILMIFVHELAHLVAGLALGHPTTLYSFAAIHGDGVPADQAAFILLIAPAFSLVSGALMQWWTPLRGRADLLHLVWLWFAFASVQEGVAYLMLTPFGAGDTGQAAQLLGLPVLVQFLALTLGIGGMFLNARSFATHLARHAGPEQKARNAMSLWVWLYGMIATVLLSVLYLAVSPAQVTPGEQIAVMAAGTVLLVFAPMANIFRAQVAEVPVEPLRIRPVPVAGLVVLGLLIGGNVLLSFGIVFD